MIMRMAIPKLSMKKKDVEYAISQYIIANFSDFPIKGREHPESLTKVLATIQSNDYHGADTYQVQLDIYGSVKDGNIGIKENEHFTSNCRVKVEQNSDNSPKISITDNMFFTKLRT